MLPHSSGSSILSHLKFVQNAFEESASLELPHPRLASTQIPSQAPILPQDWARIKSLALDGIDSPTEYRKRVERGNIDAMVLLDSENSPNPSATLIRETHRCMFGRATKDAGRFRKPTDGAIHFGGWLACEAQRIPIEMERINVEMSDLLAKTVTPDDKCASIALFHARLISVHPFLDGNGRTGRAVMESQARSMGFPFDMKVIENDKPFYINALNHARSSNDIAPLMKVVAKCVGHEPTFFGELVSNTKIAPRLMKNYGYIRPLQEEIAMAQTGMPTLPLPSIRGANFSYGPSM